MTEHQDHINQVSDEVSNAFLDMFPVQSEQSLAARTALAKYLALISKEVTEASTSAILPFIALVHTNGQELERHTIVLTEVRTLIRDHTERIDALEQRMDRLVAGKILREGDRGE